jgi:hypothetical protein
MKIVTEEDIEEGDEKQTIDRLVEIDIDDKALAVIGRSEALPYSVLVINHAVPKWHRKEYINYIKKNFAEYFDPKEAQKECDHVLRKVEELAEQLELNYINAKCNNDCLPLFDFEINLNEND